MYKPSKSCYQNIMSQRHNALAQQYQKSPQQAWTTDIASTGQDTTYNQDPLHSQVKVADINIPLGVHKAVGGDSDAPVPGELLCAALASCMDSTLRIIANRLEINLSHLQVLASAEVDVRGTLRLSENVPVAFQRIHLSVDIQATAGTSDTMMKALLNAAKASCVVMQTLKKPPQISTQFNHTNTNMQAAHAIE